MDNTKAIIIAASLLVGGATGTLITPSTFDAKEQNVKHCVDISRPDFQDRICYSDADWNAKTEAEIVAEEEARYVNYQNTLSKSATQAPTKAQIQDSIDTLNQQLSELQKLYAQTP